MSNDSAENNPVLAAIRNERGLAGKLGKHLGISRSAVWMWTRVPPKHALKVAKLMKLHPHHVSPELYPAPRKTNGQPRALNG
jgi:hypothetical protein